MFDGSHRSRRTIDLGGASTSSNRRRRLRGSTAPTTSASTRTNTAHSSSSSSLSFLRTSAVTGVQDHKSQVLESTRLLREERRQQQRQQKAALVLQTCYRGWRTRKHVATAVRQGLFNNTSNNNNSFNTTVALSLCLSLPLRPFLDASTMISLLLKFENSFLSSKSHHPVLVSLISSRRFVLATLEGLSTGTVVVPFSGMENNDDTDQALMRLLQAMLASSGFVWNKDTFLGFIACCQKWLWREQNSSHKQTQQQDHSRIMWLWQQACLAAATLGTAEAVALLGSTVFCTVNGDALLFPALEAFRISDNNKNEWTRTVLLQSFVAALLDSWVHHERRDNNEVRNLLTSRVAGREGILISNALKLSREHQTVPPLSFLELLQHWLLWKRQDVTLLTSMVVQGENIDDAVFSSSSNSGMSLQGADQIEGVDDDYESDMEDDNRFRPSIPSPAARLKKRQASSRHSRQELQTISKLDRLYREQLTRWRKDRLATIVQQDQPYKQSLVALAKQIGDPATWKEWGLLLVQEHDAHVAEVYWTLLGTLLQATSGLRVARTMSPFVSQLAFSKPFLVALWNCILEFRDVDDESDFVAMERQLLTYTVFCDLFSHHLLALSDDEFLSEYTAVGGMTPEIQVTDVILRVKGHLNEFYWIKPVLASDFAVDHTGYSQETSSRAQRARLMLSGTKLWNSLYERWCRLVRHAPFCDESVWHSVGLMSRDEHAPVVTVRDHAVDDNESVTSMDTIDDEDTPLPAVGQEDDTLAGSFRDPKMARVLTAIPQVLPFDRRVKMFGSLLHADKLKTQDETHEFRQAIMRMAEQGREFDDDFNMSGREQVQIRRDVLYDDSMSRLNGLGPRLKKKVQVSFINQHGAAEAGIDGGGVFKEFLDDLIKEAFDPSKNKEGSPVLFSVTPNQMLSVDLAMSQSPETLAHYEFLGRVLGKAVYESILVEPQFCLPFLNQLLGKQNSLEDLKNLDAQYYQNLSMLRECSDDELKSLDLAFELTLGSGSRLRTIELIPGGRSIPVTKQNVILYIHQVAHQRLNVQTALPTRAFLRGFRDLIPASWVRLFSAHELQKLISGDDTVKGFDVLGLRAAMQYAGGYHPSQPIMQWFWQVLDELTTVQQRQFLRYMTSCSRQPLLGFQALEPAPCVQQIRLPEAVFTGDDAAKNAPLPTSATCMNLLKLPNYRSKDLLREKLILAIESGSGFELT